MRIIIEPNKPSIWGPDGKWVAFTDSYNPDDSYYKSAYGDTAIEALNNVLAEIDETCEIEFIVEGGQYFMVHGGDK
jgi:hypothetical protein